MGEEAVPFCDKMSITPMFLRALPIAILFLTACTVSPSRPPPMQISSPAFIHNSLIPSLYTCDGQGISPPLAINDVPMDTKSLVLISDDPDAPMGTWVHWLLWNMGPETKEIPEDSVPQGAVEGTTSWGKTGYGGPCPPSGTHRYFFKLYALDTILDLPPSADQATLEKAIERYILAQAELVGLYSRQR